MTQLEDEKLTAKVLAEKLISGDESLLREAVQTIDKFVRETVKTSSISDAILPPTEAVVSDFASNDILQIAGLDDSLYIAVDVPEGCNAVVQLQLHLTSPVHTTIGSDRKQFVKICRNSSHRHIKEVSQLLTCNVDLVTVLCHHQASEISSRLDMQFITAVNSCTSKVYDPVKHYRVADLNYDNFKESLNYIQRLDPKVADEDRYVKTILMNAVTFRHFDRILPGFTEDTDFTSDLLTNGFQVNDLGIGSVRIVNTIRRSIVPDGLIYHFADPKYVGRMFGWVPPTSIIKQRDHALEFSVYEERGGILFDHNGMAKGEYKSVQ